MLDETVDPTTTGIHPGLPGRDYADPAVFAFERDAVFHRTWFCVGRAEEVSEPGDFVLRDVAGESILVTRTKDGQVRGHYNVCRHRGSVLVEQERGHAKAAIVCPYHNWAYSLEGRLVGTPNVHADDGLDRDAYGLRAVALEVWDGFMFVNLAERPTPLLEQLAIEPDGPLDYGRYDVGSLRIGARVEYDVAANWKIIHDNFNECLHCPSVHPELVQLVPIYRKGQVVDLERPDLGATLADGLSTFTLSGTTSLPFLPGLTDLDRRTYWGYSVLPNLMVNLLSTGVMVYTLFPEAVDRTRVVSEYLFRPETIAADGFDCSDMVDFLDLVSRQDWVVCERAQRGVGSKGFVQGVYPPQDGLLHRFAERYLAERGPLPFG
ncbi:MAG TPA: aromatic ring-hydroxylating dioxygenase subunit alpha [Actinomycetota bacterium]|nr:aromatic ring-hydroxylating dioxygenase subunit alpha [Actinomycetota bacterium]